MSVSDVAFYKADRDNPKQSPSGTGLSKKGHLDFWDVAAGDVWNCRGLTSCPRCLIWCSRCLKSVRDEGVVSGGWKTIQNCSHLQVQSRLELFVSQFIWSEVNWSTDTKRTHLQLKSILIIIFRRWKKLHWKLLILNFINRDHCQQLKPKGVINWLIEREMSSTRMMHQLLGTSLDV